jgi:hypothetical protein
LRCGKTQAGLAAVIRAVRRLIGMKRGRLDQRRRKKMLSAAAAFQYISDFSRFQQATFALSQVPLLQRYW